MNTAIKETLDFARENQISSLPIKFKDKKPAIYQWKEYQKRQPAEEEIETWFNDGSQHNIGLIGGGPNNTVFLDFDSPKIYEAFYKGNVPKTRIVKTSIGYHVYYTTREPISKDSITINMGNINANIDVQGLGSFVVCPPSIHKSGDKYQWVNNYPIKHLDVSEDQFKLFLYEHTNQICSENQWKCNKEIKHDIAIILKGVQHGSRNISGHVLASYYKEIQGFAKGEIEPLMHEWNLKNVPSLPENELSTIIESVLKPGAHTNYTFKSEGEVVKKFFDKAGMPNVIKISVVIMEDDRFITAEDTEEIYSYNPNTGGYEKNGEQKIIIACKQKFERVINNHWTKEIISYIKTCTYKSRKEFDNKPHYILLENVIYDCKNRKTISFSPDIIITSTPIPIHYDPTATCPNINKFLKDVLIYQ